MKRNSLIFFSLLLSILLIASLCGNAQTQLVEISKIYFKKEIILSDGLVYKYLIGAQADTARFFNPMADQYEAIVTFRKLGGTPTPPDPILIQAENVTSIVNAAVVGTIVGNITPGAVIRYASVDMGTRTKVSFRFSRGYTGSGSITFKVGSTSTILTFPSTGAWGTYQDAEFIIPSASGMIEINSSVIGPCNYDFFEFR